MASIQEIGELVNGFVVGKVSASDFANSFPPVLKSALKSQDQPIRVLALAVHAQISHYFNGLISEAQLRANLTPFAIVPYPSIVSVSYPEASRPSKLHQAFGIDKEGQIFPLELVGN